MPELNRECDLEVWETASTNATELATKLSDLTTGVGMFLILLLGQLCSPPSVLCHRERVYKRIRAQEISSVMSYWTHEERMHPVVLPCSWPWPVIQRWRTLASAMRGSNLWRDYFLFASWFNLEIKHCPFENTVPMIFFIWCLILHVSIQIIEKSKCHLCFFVFCSFIFTSLGDCMLSIVMHVFVQQSVDLPSSCFFFL